MLMIGYGFRFRVQREIYARSAGPGLHPGAAEYPSLFKYHGLPIRLLRARQPDAACHVDYQPGSEISYSSSRTQVNHVSGCFWTFLDVQSPRPIMFVSDRFCTNLPGRWNKTEELTDAEVKELVSNSRVKSYAFITDLYLDVSFSWLSFTRINRAALIFFQATSG